MGSLQIFCTVAVVTLIGCSTFACVNCFTDDLQMAAQKMATSLTNSMSEEAHHARVKRQACNANAILSCTQQYVRDIQTKLGDVSHICQLTRNYIKDCLKANTEGCPEVYDKAVDQQKASLDRLRQTCGDMCISRTAPCNDVKDNDSRSTDGPKVPSSDRPKVSSTTDPSSANSAPTKAVCHLILFTGLIFSLLQLK